MHRHHQLFVAPLPRQKLLEEAVLRPRREHDTPRHRLHPRRVSRKLRRLCHPLVHQPQQHTERLRSVQRRLHAYDGLRRHGVLSHGDRLFPPPLSGAGQWQTPLHGRRPADRDFDDSRGADACGPAPGAAHRTAATAQPRVSAGAAHDATAHPRRLAARRQTARGLYSTGQRRFALVSAHGADL